MLKMNDSEIILIGGFPASGKTTLVVDYPNHDRLNRDLIGGSLANIAEELEKRIILGKKKFVLDNTYSIKSQRKAIIDIGNKHGIPVVMLWMDTSIEDCQINAVVRMIQRYGKLLMPEEISAKKDPNMFGPEVLFMYRKNFEPPEQSEGFSSLQTIKFVRKVDPAHQGKALFLDYDGTLRKTKSGAKFPTNVGDIEILPGRKKILQGYAEKGYKLFGVSNQSGIAKGDLRLDVAKACFEFTNKLLGVSIEVAFCPHRVPPICCYCRKPQTGLGIQFLQKHGLDRNQTLMIGDMTTDKTFASRCGINYVPADKFFKGE
jgi:histidinol-phosphate phosphatase family protein